MDYQMISSTKPISAETAAPAVRPDQGRAGNTVLVLTPVKDYLLARVLDEEDWVLWLDVDVVEVFTCDCAVDDEGISQPSARRFAGARAFRSAEFGRARSEALGRAALRLYQRTEIKWRIFVQ